MAIRAGVPSNSYLTQTLNSSISTNGIVLSLWFNTASTQSGTLFAIYDSGGSGEMSIGIVSDGTVFIETVSGAGTDTSTGGSYSTNTWHLLSGMFSSDTDRELFLDGSSVATGTTDIDAGNMDTARLSATQGGTRVRVQLADAAIWDGTELDVPDMASIVSGLSHRNIPGGVIANAMDMVSYSRLINPTIIPDEMQGKQWTLTGNFQKLNHPMIVFSKF